MSVNVDKRPENVQRRMRFVEAPLHSEMYLEKVKTHQAKLEKEGKIASASSFDNRALDLDSADHLRHLGPRGRFGDGDGTWWDRWLISEPPALGSASNGIVPPQTGFKKRILDTDERRSANARERRAADEVRVRYHDAPEGDLSGGRQSLPPHLYAVAEQARRRRATPGAAQAILVGGESGAGKTEAVKIVMQYLCQATAAGQPCAGRARRRMERARAGRAAGGDLRRRAAHVARGRHLLPVRVRGVPGGGGEVGAARRAEVAALPRLGPSRRRRRGGHSRTRQSPRCTSRPAGTAGGGG